MKHRSRGMTLLELMMAVSVVAILTAIAVPGFRQFMSNSRTTATTNDLVSALNLARSEALRRASNAVVCASDDQATCSGDTDWATGWIAFADPNADGDVDADELLRSWPAVEGGVTVEGGSSSVTYTAMGMRQLPAAATITFTVVAPACNGVHAGETEVQISGAIRSRKVACP
jgi:type IV fimbrial biogenesis protein FimT